MTDVATLAITLFRGVAIGCIYILLAAGLNLIFGVMKLVNFAHGELLMIGAYVCYWFSSLLGLNPYMAVFVSMAIVSCVGIIIEKLCFHRVLGTTKLNEIFLSLGLIYVFNHIAIFLWGTKSKIIASPFEYMVIDLGIMKIGYDLVIAIQVVIVILFTLLILLRKTKIGRAMRATSQNKEAAMIMGINVDYIYMLSFALGSALAAAAGALYGIIFTLSPYMGQMGSVKAFTIIILGGLGSIPGAVVGGLLYGIAENLAVLFLGGIWKDAVGFAVLIAVLIVRPTGIFGERAG